MRRNTVLTYIAVVAVLILPALACAPADQDASTEPSAEIVQIEEIPVTTASESARALYDEGLYLLDVGRGVEAREKFQAAIAEDPAFVSAHFNQSNASLSFKEFQTCLDSASEHLEHASEGERMMVEVNRTFLTNNTAHGVELARELVGMYPNSPRAHLLLAGMLTNQNDAAGARSSLEKAASLDPQSAGALFAMAGSYLGTEPKDFANAEEWAAKALAAYPNEAKGHELMGDIKRAQNDLEAALASYNSASETDPTLANAHHKRGHVNSFLGNIEDARSAYDSGVEMAAPESKAGLAVYKTFTKIHEGNVPAALDELEALAAAIEGMGTPAHQVKGLQIFAMDSHATAALHAGLFKRAEKSIKEGNELRMAVAEDVGTDDARRLQEAACNNWDGLLAAYRGKPKAAAKHAEKITELLANDDNPRKMEAVHYVLGMSALEAGDHAAAAEHLAQADHKNNMFIRYNLALAQEALGNNEEAKKLFGEVGSFNFNSVGFALIGRDARERASA